MFSHFTRQVVLAASLLTWAIPAFAQAPAPVPALPDTERRTTYSISNSTCACAVGFQLYGDSTDYGNWIEVWVNGVMMTQSGNWTLSSPSGPLANLSRPITNAVLTFVNPQTGTVQIVGARRPRRTSQFSESRGVAARDLNQVLSDLTAQNRETWDKTNDITGRVPRVPPGETLAMLPVLASRANQGACFDNLGNLTSCVAVAGSTFIAGNGISFTGTNPTTISTATYAAGVGVQFNGTNPTVISVSQTTGVPILSSRTVATTQDLSAYSVVTTLGYTSPGDGGGATFRKISAANNFIDSQVTTATITGGTGCTNGTYPGLGISGGSGRGMVATITAAGGAVTAVNFAYSPGNAYKVGDVLSAGVPGCTGFALTVTGVTTALASFTDSVGTKFQFVVDQGGYANPRQFGAKMDWDGNDATATNDFNSMQAALRFVGYGSATTQDSGGWQGGKLRIPSGSSLLCPTAGLSLLVPFGVTVSGAGAAGGSTFKMCDAINPSLHFIELCDPNWQRTCFNARMEHLSIFSKSTVAAASSTFLVHSNVTQDFGGLFDIYMYGGGRGCTWFEKGYGGAGYVKIEDVGCQSNTSTNQMQFGNAGNPSLNYGTTIFEMRNIGIGGPSSGTLQTGFGMVLEGDGFFDITGMHCEGTPVCINIHLGAVPAVGSMVTIRNLNAGSGAGSPCLAAISLQAGNSPGNTAVSMVPGGSCTYNVSNGQPGGTSILGGTRIPPGPQLTMFNP
ncbi:hypothetical protein BSZ19_47040 [Bradyrhizobium japonicum]|uniref:Uncharacterized protein n=1 Tax=Bradyrhizobium japonicum TaxID=375 RepID=A0A1Y2J7R2_BRAJP|nr:hypothetical protein [Bradyrhizobium japonicum]OSJ22148.1 hypothetical protein BSZ19_47040 [Bradyrhizobium japonicum]